MKALLAIPTAILLIVTTLQSCKTTGGNKPETDSLKVGVFQNDFAPKFTEPNSLSYEEKSEGWVLLFNGTTTNNFRGYNSDSFPENSWEITDGTLHCTGIDTVKTSLDNSIITLDKYTDFELSLDWKISSGGTSGVFVLVQEKPNEPIWKIAPKMQLVDNKVFLSNKLVNNDIRKAGSLCDIIPAKPLNAKPTGDWNNIRIIVFRGTIVFYQNGEKVLEFQIGSKEWNNLINKSIYKGKSEIINLGGADRNGHIGLQNTGSEVWFRNIKIRTVQ